MSSTVLTCWTDPAKGTYVRPMQAVREAMSDYREAKRLVEEARNLQPEYHPLWVRT